MWSKMCSCPLNGPNIYKGPVNGRFDTVLVALFQVLQESLL